MKTSFIEGMKAENGGSPLKTSFIEGMKAENGGCPVKTPFIEGMKDEKLKKTSKSIFFKLIHIKS
ncbi:hypothetical protein [Neobacillus niacini]|uniref:hypothetical protein n=1 Tax=Neobacillus niacini TaxID=86668 RepID=UPI0028595443|nr:hypothetical protein [Neobacillus niacini]MDR6998240.1 hypothetical protein [Neobacillus niacini]